MTLSMQYKPHKYQEYTTDKIINIEDYSDLNMYHKRIDVRWDLFKRPILLDEIIELMKDRKNLEY